MAKVVEMPRLSDTMTEGVIAAWHKKVGDTLKIGDLLAEIETDKATMDFESPFDGVLLHTGVQEGKGISVGALLAVIGNAGEDISGIVAGAGAGVPKVEAQPQAQQETVQVSTSPTVMQAAVTGEDGRTKASPLAKAIAKDMGIDLKSVAGTGEGGRIVKRDLESKQGGTVQVVQQPVQQPVKMAPIAVPATASFEDHTLSQMRKTIARRLSESKFSAPHFYLTMEIHMDKASEMRKSLNEIAPVKISFNDIVIKACAAALRLHPAINSSWMGDFIRQNNEINIGMAVAIEDGLIVPVIRHADTKGLSTIATEAKDLAEKARTRKLDPSAWSGNTFSISNLGMFGIEEFTAIINPPDACILAVGAIKQTPVVKDGQIAIGSVMKVTLSCDHRVVDGAMGAAFLVTLRDMLQDPMKMLL